MYKDESLDKTNLVYIKNVKINNNRIKFQMRLHAPL